MHIIRDKSVSASAAATTNLISVSDVGLYVDDDDDDDDDDD